MTKSVEFKTRLSINWFIILAGLIYHTVLHIAPVLYGAEFTKADSTGNMPFTMVLIFGFSYCIPVAAILFIQYLRNQAAKKLNIVLASFALLVNTSHLSEILIKPQKLNVQLFVLIPLFLVSVLLITDSIKWLKHRL